MALRDTSIDPRLLESAKKHFGEKGFLGAQLSDICKDAGVTTGAVYKRYKGKEELFEAVVKDTIDRMNELLEKSLAVDPKVMSDEALIAVWTDSEANTASWYEFMLGMRDGLELVLNCSDGTKYSHFHDEWLERMSDNDYRFLKELQDRDLADKSITKLELHVMVTAMWEIYSEPIVHRMSDDEIRHHFKVAERLFDWSRAVGIKQK